MPTYELVVAKNGPKLKAAEPGSRIAIDNKPLSAGRGGVLGGEDGRHLAAKGGTISLIVNSLMGELHAPVTDRTGLKGRFNFKLEFDPPMRSSHSADSAPDIFEAVQVQLGLKLEGKDGPVEVLVVDHAEKASAN